MQCFVLHNQTIFLCVENSRMKKKTHLRENSSFAGWWAGLGMSASALAPPLIQSDSALSWQCELLPGPGHTHASLPGRPWQLQEQN